MLKILSHKSHFVVGSGLETGSGCVVDSRSLIGLGFVVVLGGVVGSRGSVELVDFVVKLHMLQSSIIWCSLLNVVGQLLQLYRVFMD